MDTEEQVYTREAGKMWWIPLVAGIAWLMIAVVIMRMNVTSVATVGILIGAMFLGAAINEFVLGASAEGGWKVLHYIMGVLFALGSMWGFFRPINTFFALVSVLGILLALMGTFEVARAISSKAQNDLWWLGLISGIAMLLLAFWVSGSGRLYNTAERTYVILFWVGFMSLFRGIAQIGIAFALRKAGRAAEA